MGWALVREVKVQAPGSPLAPLLQSPSGRSPALGPSAVPAWLPGAATVARSLLMGGHKIYLFAIPLTRPPPPPLTGPWTLQALFALAGCWSRPGFSAHCKQTPKKSCSIIIGKPGFRSLGKCQKGKQRTNSSFLHQSPVGLLDHAVFSTKHWVPGREGKSNNDP